MAIALICSAVYTGLTAFVCFREGLRHPGTRAALNQGVIGVLMSGVTVISVCAIGG